MDKGSGHSVGATAYRLRVTGFTLGLRVKGKGLRVMD